MELNEIQIDVLAGRSDYYGQGWSDPKRLYNDPFSRLYWMRSGKAYTKHHNQLYTIEPGKLFLIPSNTDSHFECTRTMRLEWVHFNATVAGTLDLFRIADIQYAVKVPAISHTQLLMDMLLAEIDNETNTQARGLRMDGLLRVLLSEFFRCTTWRINSDITRLYSALVYIQKNFAHRISLDELAACVHLQPTYFSNLFSRLIGRPPLEYLLHYRISRGQLMIKTTSKSLHEISEQVGFNDVYYFSKCFKRFIGLPPGEFRKRCQTSQP